MSYSVEENFKINYHPLVPTPAELHIARTVALGIMQQCSADLAIKGNDAAIISERITYLLAEQAFHMSPVTLMFIHRKLFADILPDAGILRRDKKLNDYLRACFDAEREFSYKGLSRQAVQQKLADFSSRLLALAPFADGNRPAVLVFMEKYKQYKGMRGF